MYMETKGPEQEAYKQMLEQKRQKLLDELAGVERELKSFETGAQQSDKNKEVVGQKETKRTTKLIPGFTVENEAESTQTKIEYTSDGKEGMRWKAWPDPAGTGDMFLQAEVPKGADVRRACSAGLFFETFEQVGQGWPTNIPGTIEPALFKILQPDVKKIPELTDNCSDVSIGAGAVVIDRKFLVKKGKVQFR